MDEETTELVTTDPEMRQLLGMFDVPAFARRGQELESSLARLQARCLRERDAMLEMPRLRLRQWSSVSTGPDDLGDVLSAPLGPLVALIATDPISWSASPGPPRRRASIARDLSSSVDRFNRRWAKFLSELNLGPINGMIEQYNRYYLLEKECVFGSARVASRHFLPRPSLTSETLLVDYPLLPPVSLRS